MQCGRCFTGIIQANQNESYSVFAADWERNGIINGLHIAITNKSFKRLLVLQKFENPAKSTTQVVTTYLLNGRSLLVDLITETDLMPLHVLR